MPALTCVRLNIKGTSGKRKYYSKACSAEGGIPYHSKGKSWKERSPLASFGPRAEAKEHLLGAVRDLPEAVA